MIYLEEEEISSVGSSYLHESTPTCGGGADGITTPDTTATASLQQQHPLYTSEAEPPIFWPPPPPDYGLMSCETAWVFQRFQALKQGFSFYLYVNDNRGGATRPATLSSRPPSTDVPTERYNAGDGDRSPTREHTSLNGLPLSSVTTPTTSTTEAAQPADVWGPTAPSSQQQGAAAAAQWGKPISIFDMTEIVVTCPSLTAFCNRQALACAGTRTGALNTYAQFSRRIGVHAGITLYNLHRVLCYCCEFNEALSETPLHTWIVPNCDVVYGNGEAFRREARKRKTLVTDKTIALSEFLPADNWTGYQIEYSLGGLVFNVLISDLVKGQTVQQDLLWVPRLCDGSFGRAPPDVLVTDTGLQKVLNQYSSRRPFSARDIAYGTSRSYPPGGDSDTGSTSASEESSPEALAANSTRLIDILVNARPSATGNKELSIDSVNRVLSETRFGRNLAVSRKSKRTRIMAFKEEAARLVQFRLPIRAFFGQSGRSVDDFLVDRPAKRRRRSSRQNRDDDDGICTPSADLCGIDFRSPPVHEQLDLDPDVDR